MFPNSCRFRVGFNTHRYHTLVESRVQVIKKLAGIKKNNFKARERSDSINEELSSMNLGKLGINSFFSKHRKLPK